MTCLERDQDLLLLAHNALPFGARLKTRWHVAQCARCRVRLNEFEMVSRVLAATMHPRAAQGGLAQIPLGNAVPSGLSLSSILLTMLAIAVLIGVTATIVHKFQADRVQLTRTHHHFPPGCAPNLPNDHCH